MSDAINANVPGNTCFGCGFDNPDGLRIEILRDPTSKEALVGRYQPRPTHGGFPAIVHGGLQFTVLDCIAGWTALVMRSGVGTVPLTVNATIRYARPARTGTTLSLRAEVMREAPSPKEPIGIRATVFGEDGAALTEADFSYATLPVEKFLKLVGATEVPDHWDAIIRRPPSLFTPRP